ncbi:SRPBCC domain-containing protein [Hyphomicrobium sp.]|uniref:SRPBCC domain-containing protein n=1 Tax=Hyphomicrobium sp. TaxID=82 RepID=UPI002E31251E|nr:SRPBCC domain-containing protein [Hyphomicrobium sp.]HEX2840051.1 SRPBCC domain-containing protein [Hyphomicrobium sp.]
MAARKNSKAVSVTMVRKLNSTPGAVYAAWTEPSLVARWLAPGADAVTSVTMDVRKGGRYRIEGRHGDGSLYSFSGTYLDLAVDHRVAMSWVYDGPVHALKSGASIVVAEIRPLGSDLTELTLTHEKLSERDEAEIYRVSWSECMGKLENVAADLPHSRKHFDEQRATDFYSDSQREMQDRFKTRALADRLEAVLVHDHLSASDAAFIACQNMFFIATADAYGQPNCSYKGGARGFVTVVDERTVAFPDYNGNGMHLSVGNINETGKVGLLFIDFERQARMRVLGTATSVQRDPLLARYPGAQIIVRVNIESVFSNCPRYVHKMRLVEESAFVPESGAEPPVPDWKKLNTVADVLPDEDKKHAGNDIDISKTLNKG